MSLNALCISDLQIPFEHKDALRFCVHVKQSVFRDIEPHVVNMGDEVDQHTLSNWDSDPDGLSGGQEQREAEVRLADWYREFPKTFVCMSNHTFRAWKKARKHGIPSAFMKTVGEVYKAPPGWQWREKWVSNGITFEHGENVSGPTAALNAAIQNQMSTVIGHQHSHAGVMYRDSDTVQIFGMNTGCLIDRRQYAFDYGKNIRIKPTLGCGVIVKGIPHFIPMITDHQGNWVGRI